MAFEGNKVLSSRNMMNFLACLLTQKLQVLKKWCVSSCCFMHSGVLEIYIFINPQHIFSMNLCKNINVLREIANFAVKSRSPRA